MSFYGQSLLSTHKLSLENIYELFSFATEIKEQFLQRKTSFLPHWQSYLQEKVTFLVFFEPSTRTAMSFQMACQRLKLPFINFPSEEQSSLSKGETLVDTLLNLKAMNPDLFVIRSGPSVELMDFLDAMDVPVINAGSGAEEHPTQALLDAFTIEQRLGRVKGQRVLFVGDVRHSRVASSNLELFTRMGAQVAICSPESMQPTNEKWNGIQRFAKLTEALDWATVVMGLRVQLERHSDANVISPAEYSREYCLTP
ncbi:MAG: hypothetical protein KDD40_08250, partial [Bdellovibrionales bacterium]|nr:hypothetical protein [Bdellovibrionales bacterium]